MDRIFYVKSAKLRIKDAQEDKIVRARLLRMPLDREKRVVTEPLRLVTKLLESNKKVTWRNREFLQYLIRQLYLLPSIETLIDPRDISVPSRTKIVSNDLKNIFLRVMENVTQ